MQLPAGVSAVDAVKALPEATRSQIVGQIKEKFDDMPEMMTVQSAILFVQNEYEALGKDLDSLQISYLVKVGVQMVLLALLAMLASVLVTFFSARVAATVAHDLRGDVYRKVIGLTATNLISFQPLPGSQEARTIFSRFRCCWRWASVSYFIPRFWELAVCSR